MAEKSRYKWLITGGSLILLGVHGVWSRFFKVDAISVALLAIASIPFMKQYFESLKIGDLEFQFGSLKLNGVEQSFLFLENIIVKTEKQVTFYPQREDESRLGEPFRNLVQELISKERSQLIEKVREWIQSDNDNLRWFASEIIGYFQIQDLKNNLLPVYQQIMAKPHDTCSDWQLNCLWAYSRFNDYKEVHELLQTTNNAETQKWLLKVYSQMVIAHPEENKHERFIHEIEKFLQRSEIQEEAKNQAKEVLKVLNALKSAKDAKESLGKTEKLS